MNTKIKQAIESRKVLEFYYKDDLRIVEPHTYGVTKTGKGSLRAYQVGGNSTDSETIGWKLFTVDKIQNLQIKEISFVGTRDGYNPNDSIMTSIYARL
ncbi:MAG: hypothetical protein WC141_06890 [Arcobacteraceae bacterium]